jgi:hypothetical protein
MMMQYPGASVNGVIEAPIEDVWEIVSDVRRHSALAGSGEVKQVEVLSKNGLGKDGLFRSQQRMRGINYVTVSRVVAWDPPYTFAWQIGFPFAPGIAQVWLFNLTPAANGTRVENGVALPYAMPNIWPFRLLLQDFGRREAKGIPATLHNLARTLGAPLPKEIDVRYEAPAIAVSLLPPAIWQVGVWAGVALVGGALLRGRKAS